MTSFLACLWLHRIGSGLATDLGLAGIQSGPRYRFYVHVFQLLQWSGLILSPLLKGMDVSSTAAVSLKHEICINLSTV